MLRIAIAAVVLLAASVVTVRYIDRGARAPAVTKTAAPSAASAPGPAASRARTMVIKAGQGGHFEVEARVDGRRIAFLVDTGASQIALRASDAARLGLHPSKREYSVKIMTANGEGRAAPVQLRSVEVGDIVVRNIPALVAPDEALSVNLLGMSFLSRVRWSHERGRLVLEQ